MASPLALLRAGARLDGTSLDLTLRPRRRPTPWQRPAPAWVELLAAGLRIGVVCYFLPER